MTTNISKVDTREFNAGGARSHMILIVMSLLMMINFMDRQVMAVVLEPLKLDMGWNDAQAGIIQTAFLISMALFSYPAAYMVDRWSRRKAVGIMAITWSLFTYLTGLATGFVSFLLPRMMVGIGEAAFQAGGMAWISAAYEKHLRGRVIGIFTMAIPFGAAMGTILGGYLSTHYGGWRTPFYVFAIPGILLGIVAFFLKDYKTVKHQDDAGNHISFLSSALTLFRIPTLKWLYLGFAMQNIMAFSFLAWGPAYLMRALEITEARAGMLFGMMALMGIIGAPLGGFIADKWQMKNKHARMLFPAICLIMCALTLALALMMSFKGVGLIIGLSYGLFSVMGLPAISSATQDVVTPNLKGTAWGLNVFCMYVFGGGWAPAAVGFMSDAFGGGASGLQVALLLTTIGGVFASVSYWLSSRHYPTDLERVKHFTLQAEK